MFLIARSVGQSSLIAAIRSDNLYPPGSHAKKIAASIVDLYASDDDQTLDILFDDKEMLTKEQEDEGQFEDLKEDVDLDEDDETDELDNLLDDDDIKIKTTTSALKIAEDDSVDVDDES